MVNYGDTFGDCRSMNGIISDFICSEDKEGLLEVIADTFMSMDAIIFKWLALIPSIVFSNIGSGSNVATSKLFLKQNDENSIQRMWYLMDL